MLELKNISKKFATKEVLNNITLNIKEKEIISLLGESGSGKSTLLNIIAGFEQANTGIMLYQNKTIFSDTIFYEPEKRNIGFVFQNYALFPHLNIAKNISFGISKESKSIQKKRVSHLLKLIDMEGFEKKYPHQISGGQQQRVAIARVLARESDLILFDEAFSSIDTTLKLKLIFQIKEIIKSQGKTAIFVTHDPKEALLLSDRIAYVEDGKIIQFDTPMQLHKNPISKSVSDLFGEESFMFKNISELVQ